MTFLEANARLDEIIEELNDMREESMELPLYGAITEDMALDMIRDDVDEPNEYCADPDAPTPEEMERIRELVAANVATTTRFEERREALFDEYRDIASVYPHIYDSGHVARNWHDKI